MKAMPARWLVGGEPDGHEIMSMFSLVECIAGNARSVTECLTAYENETHFSPN
jgi:hypothetical protein